MEAGSANRRLSRVGAWVSSAGLVCLSSLVLVAAADATTMDGTAHVDATFGSGSVKATGLWGAAAWVYDATLTTQFTPSQIEPGEGFTFTAKNIERVNESQDPLHLRPRQRVR